MKSTIKYILLLVIPLVVTGALITSCQEDDLPNGGKPIIYYVRNTDVEKSDSLYAGAYLGNLVAIMGDNLGDTRKIFFNDQEAEVISTYVTNKSIIVNVPNDVPKEKTDKLVLVFGNGQTLEYDFVVEISAPIIEAMSNEYAAEGDVVKITGNYFFDPMVVTFTGGATAEVVSVDQHAMEIKIPGGAQPGPITFQSVFGETESALQYRDPRVVINYDEAGKTPTTVSTWRYGLIVEDANSLTGKYLKMTGSYGADDNPRNEGPGGASTYESQFWAQTSGRTQNSVLPDGVDPSLVVMKFEAKVVSMHGVYLNICFGPYNNANNDEIYGNTYNARAIWGPWDVDGETFSTGGEWVTVTIPITEFKWAMDTENNEVVYSPRQFSKDITGSLSFWVLAAPEANGTPFELLIDNVRFVPNN